MTIERRLARAEFTLTRHYPVPVERVWNAFASEQEKLSWWGAGMTAKQSLETSSPTAISFKRACSSSAASPGNTFETLART